MKKTNNIRMIKKENASREKRNWPYWNEDRLSIMANPLRGGGAKLWGLGFFETARLPKGAGLCPSQMFASHIGGLSHDAQNPHYYSFGNLNSRLR